jgi:hypothetical protein
MRLYWIRTPFLRCVILHTYTAVQAGSSTSLLVFPVSCFLFACVSFPSLVTLTEVAKTLSLIAIAKAADTPSTSTAVGSLQLAVSHS